MAIKIIRNITAVISAVIIVIAVTMLLFQIKPAVVLSGSMEPTIKTGSLIFIEKKDKEIRKGDIIAFSSGNMIVVHRAERKTEAGWITKGDGNNCEDIHAIKEDDIRGTVRHWIPKLGYVIRGIKGGVDMRRGTAFCIAMLILSIGTTLAYLIGYEMRINKISVGENFTEIREVWSAPNSLKAGNDYRKCVEIVNKSSVPCYIRVFADTVSPEMRDAIEVDFNNDKWLKKENGYYYYKEIVLPGEKTESLMNVIHAINDMENFEFIVYEESVQSEGFKTAEMAFNSIGGEMHL